MTDTVRVFVNGRGLDAPAAGVAVDAVSLHSAADGAAVREGALLIADSRGLPISAEAPLYNGAVFRLIPNRARDGADSALHVDG